MAQKDYLELLNQPRRYAVDFVSLEAAKTKLLARLHPDRFVNASALEKRIAQQLTVQVNEAYATLSDDLKRAQYLCKLAGLDVNARKAMPPEFLMRQMMWHEALEAAQESANETLRGELDYKVKAERETLLVALTQAFDETSDTTRAYELTRELMFIEKLASQI